MTSRTLSLALAMTVAASALAGPSAWAGGGGKETWIRTKPHVNKTANRKLARPRPSASQHSELVIFVTPRLVTPTK